MTKRIAILGCSHSDWQQGPTERRGWIEQIATQYPNIEFHSFARMGHGSLWYDFILKHIIANFEPNYFDAVIIQLTAQGRWLFPLRHSVEKEKWIVHPFKDRDVPNYITYTLKSHRIVSTQMGSFEAGSYLPDWEHEPWGFRGGPFYEFPTQFGINYTANFPNEEYDNFSLQYEDVFGDTLIKLYRPHFNNFFYFTFFNSYSPGKYVEFKKYHVGNIGQPKPFVQWSIDKYGAERTVLDFFDDSWHTSQSGENIFVNEYILPSEIGNYLRR